jgi:hypothetical protein
VLENNSSIYSDSADAHQLLLIHLERMLMLVQMRRKMLSNLRLPHGTPIDRAKQKKSEILTVPLILIFLLWVGIACAQSTFGSIRGTAQDSSDAALPDMQITLESVDKKTDRTVKTDGARNYLLENVLAGSYQVRA